MKVRRIGKAQNCDNGAGNLTDKADCLDNVGSLTSHDPPRPLTGIAFTPFMSFYYFLYDVANL
jgi:hypothetical protein